jgi:hypothetical protein
VLLKAGIIEKVPSLTKAGQLSIRYKVCDNATELLKTILEATLKIQTLYASNASGIG